MLDELQTRIADKNVLLLGVGNRQREDDGVGSYLVRRLQRKIRIPSLDAGDVPENYIKQIENSGADFLLIVDAADFGANPGEIALIDLGDLRKMGGSTHSANLPLLLDIIPKNSAVEIFLELNPVLGIVPGFGFDFQGAIGVRFYP